VYAVVGRYCAPATWSRYVKGRILWQPQFRMFENDAGIDVVRAMHLDMSGRPIPDGSEIIGERFVIEPWELANWVATRHNSRPPLGGFGRPRVAWLSADDPLPVRLAIMFHGVSLRQGAVAVPLGLKTVVTTRCRFGSNPILTFCR
jgi:hypothetical protein